MTENAFNSIGMEFARINPGKYLRGNEFHDSEAFWNEILRQGYEDAVKEWYPENGDIVITAEEVHKKGIEILEQYLSGDVPYYVTVDIDVLDPSIAPGTGTPEPGGFSYRQMRDMLSIVGKTHKLRAIDVVEVNPLFDQTTNTAQHAVRLLIDLLGEHFNT